MAVYTSSTELRADDIEVRSPPQWHRIYFLVPQVSSGQGEGPGEKGWVLIPTASRRAGQRLPNIDSELTAHLCKERMLSLSVWSVEVGPKRKPAVPMSLMSKP